MPRCAKAILPLVSLLLFPLTAYAQASIVGVVRDASGAVLPSAVARLNSSREERCLNMESGSCWRNAGVAFASFTSRHML